MAVNQLNARCCLDDALHGGVGAGTSRTLEVGIFDDGQLDVIAACALGPIILGNGDVQPLRWQVGQWVRFAGCRDRFPPHLLNRLPLLRIFSVP